MENPNETQYVITGEQIKALVASIGELECLIDSFDSELVSDFNEEFQDMQKKLDSTIDILKAIVIKSVMETSSFYDIRRKQKCHE